MRMSRGALLSHGSLAPGLQLVTTTRQVAHGRMTFLQMKCGCTLECVCVLMTCNIDYSAHTHTDKNTTARAHIKNAALLRLRVGVCQFVIAPASKCVGLYLHTRLVVVVVVAQHACDFPHCTRAFPVKSQGHTCCARSTGFAARVQTFAATMSWLVCNILPSWK